MTLTLPNGIGESLGDTLVTSSPLLVDNEVLYVDSTNADASDASSYGRLKSKPFATLAYAFTQAAAGDIIVLLDGHTETLATELDIDLAITVVGAGQASGKPTVKLSGTHSAGTAMLLISASNVQIRNIWFEEFASGLAAHHIEVADATNTLIKGCYFEADGNNESECVEAALGLSGTNVLRFEDCTFVSTATDPAAQPLAGVAVRGEGIVEVRNCVFDDGEVGWSSNAYFAQVLHSIRAEGVSVLRGATFEYYEHASHFAHINASAPDGLGGKVERNN